VRDSGIDVVKAFCLLVVVGLHSLMGAVTLGEDGMRVTNALAGNYAFAWATWGVQVMPLFFLLGGFGSITQWRRMRDQHEATPADYIRQRVNRLARPAVLPILLVGGTLAVVVLSGLSSDGVLEIGHKISQPLWFLAVYLGCSSFVPLMARFHDAAPRITLLALLALSLVVDTIGLHVPPVSALNFLFVWLFMQQLGFWFADGAFSKLPRWSLLVFAFASYGALAVLTLVVGYSKDMYENLNPPTTCILVLGVGQIFLVAFFKPQLDAIAQVPLVRRSAAVVNANSMTIYLWHVPIVVLIGLMFVGTATPLPEPLSGSWWQTRPLVLLLVAVALVPVVLLLKRMESRTLIFVPARMPAVLAALKVIFSVTGVAIILIVGFTPVWSWAIGLVLLAVAVWIGPPRMRALRPAVHQRIYD
jgi:hypothetical protein